MLEAIHSFIVDFCNYITSELMTLSSNKGKIRKYKDATFYMSKNW